MKRVGQFVVGLLATLGALVVVFNVIGPDNLIGSACRTVLLRETVSPNGEFHAWISSQVCDEPSRNGVYVSMRQGDDVHHRQIRIADVTTTEFEMTWVSNDRLDISAELDLQDGDTLGDLYGVWIRYRAR